ncbi:MAG: GNAT family N-acetyltransferase [Anaerolineales bacterium]|nr:GNAT family N-acetyltransferase [Anaerolineales bacterium]
MEEYYGIRPIRHGEEVAAYELVHRVFHAEIAPLYNKEGVSTFLEFVQPENLARLLAESMEILVADSGKTIAGMTAVREKRHISLLFVDRPFQSQGTGRRLLQAAVDFCRASNPGLECVTVNASPNSVSFYSHVGFKAKGQEMIKDGIRYTPMLLDRSLFDKLIKKTDR